jgi:hypothetical protein
VRCSGWLALGALWCSTLPARADDGLSVRGHVDALGAVESVLPTDSAVNPGNTLHLPLVAGAVELRPSLTVDWGSWLTLSLRPRLRLSAALARTDGAWDGGRGAASVDLAELSATWRVADWLSFTWGLQNFQWGPAELASPSNRLFHETGLLRDPLYFVAGHHLVRVNASAGKTLSAVLLAELTAPPEAFVSGEVFGPRGQLKLEWSDEAGRGLVGVTGGLGTLTWPYFGEYAQWQLTDGLSVYVDASHSAQRLAWYPQLGADGFSFVHRATTDLKRLSTLAVGGLRYTFESGVDARAEVLLDDAGWTRDELKLAATSAMASGQAGPLSAPGLEYLGRALAYASLRLPDLPPRKHLALTARYALSLTDGSGAAFLTASLEASDALVVFASALVTHGASWAEFSRLARASFFLGLTHTW